MNSLWASVYVVDTLRTIVLQVYYLHHIAFLHLSYRRRLEPNADDVLPSPMLFSFLKFLVCISRQYCLTSLILKRYVGTSFVELKLEVFFAQVRLEVVFCQSTYLIFTNAEVFLQPGSQITL